MLHVISMLMFLYNMYVMFNVSSSLFSFTFTCIYIYIYTHSCVFSKFLQSSFFKFILYRLFLSILRIYRFFSLSLSIYIYIENIYIYIYILFSLSLYIYIYIEREILSSYPPKTCHPALGGRRASSIA